jgi:hypothetical protein
MKLFALCLLLAASLAAADVTGKWHGEITTHMADATMGGKIPAYLDLAQSGSTITGRAGGSADKTHEITGGKLEGDLLTLSASPSEGHLLIFKLTVKGDTLDGEVVEDGNVIGAARLTRDT